MMLKISLLSAILTIALISGCSSDDPRPNPRDAAVPFDAQQADEDALPDAPTEDRLDSGTEAEAPIQDDSDAAATDEPDSAPPEHGVWNKVADENEPSPRQTAAAVWTGSKMIVWGGGDAQGELNTGGLYDPATDSWTNISTANAPSGRLTHTMVWTGSKALVWGGGKYMAAYNDGAAYDPATDSWTPISNVGAPIQRTSHTAVWTGTKMIVWGGYDVTPYAMEAGVGQYLGDGAAYDPATDSWTPISNVGAPSSREAAKAVWTGTKMIVWGGSRLGQNPISGGIYDPSSDTWSEMSTVNAPIGRIGHSLAWTGFKVIVWGGIDTYNHQLLGDGASYDPATDSWTTISQIGGPSKRERHTTVWTGTEMIVWGGTDVTYLSDGAAYNPATDIWTPIPSIGTPQGRMEHITVWTGSAMIVWGGYGGLGIGFLGSGGIFSP